ncbi:MAG: gephyrin-like molybdotransferase Glp [Chloroflexota bacterium]
MPEFIQLTQPSVALDLFIQNLPGLTLESELIDPRAALGRVTAEDLHAPHPLPSFPRSTVDGYAVLSGDTFSASDSSPAYLALAGEVPMGSVPSIEIHTGQCALIHTGGMLPAGADAVVMLEYTQSSLLEIELSRAVAMGENVIQVGEDVVQGQVVITRGTRLGPAEIGGCMALGITRLRVVSRPKVAIISSGDEVLPPENEPRPGQVRDVNSYTLQAMIQQAGGSPVLYGIVRDDLSLMKVIAEKALNECDIVLITAGSSASSRDTTVDTIRTLGEPGVLVHGVNLRPGKPTILAVCGSKAVVGLPGNPVSALIIARLFVLPVIGRLLGEEPVTYRPKIRARLIGNLPSQAGREDWIAVRIKTEVDAEGEVHYLADPVFGKSNLIFTLVAADGLICIPADVTGVSSGEYVEVELLH